MHDKSSLVVWQKAVKNEWLAADWLTWLEDFDNDSLIVLSVDAFIDFRVLSSTDFLDNLVVVLGPKQIAKEQS